MNEHFQDAIEKKLRSFKFYKTNVETAKYVTVNFSKVKGHFWLKKIRYIGIWYWYSIYKRVTHLMYSLLLINQLCVIT